MSGPTRLCFLSVTHDLSDCGWDDPRIERLWRYNLHYFDDLNAVGASHRSEWHRSFLERWLIDNPPPHGTAWEPYPTSLRIVNWIKWFLAGHKPEPHWLHSLAVQVRWLRRRLEWHLLGNHLLANAKALVFAGLYFEGNEAHEWLDTGLGVLGRELPEQVLADGGHFERSTMYHALVLEDLLDLINATVALAHPTTPAHSQSQAWRDRAEAMLHWLRCMSHPDGGIAFFNDAAHGIAPSNAELEAYAARLGIQATEPPVDGSVDLWPSGYVRMAYGSAVALLDLAPIGPDYLLGHAHADTLSFELSLAGRRVVVNGGTSCYGLSAQRLRERGTAWHSTVQVGAGNSSEVWSGFRVGRRARIIQRHVDTYAATGAHDGWHHLKGRPVHRRRWQFDRDTLWVDDELGPTDGDAVARYHFAPGLQCQPGDTSDTWHVTDEAQRCLAEVVVTHGTVQAEPSEHAPCFGLRLPACTLAVRLVDGRARTGWRWNSDAHPVPD